MMMMMMMMMIKSLVFNEISLHTKDLILHIVLLPPIGYMINLMMAWKKAKTFSCP